MIAYWLYKFEVEDRDVGIVDYVSIDESLDIPLPVASVCISLPFLKPRMLEQINLTTYYTFISGLGSYEEYDFEQNLAHVDYSSVTLKLGDYSALNETRLRNMSKYESIDDSVYYKESFNGFDAESFASAFGKCFPLWEIQGLLRFQIHRGENGGRRSPLAERSCGTPHRDIQDPV